MVDTIVGARIDLDIYVHDEDVYFMEIKSLIEVDDIEWFNQKCEIVEGIIGRKLRRKIGVNMVREAYERAKELNIEAIYEAIIEWLL